jgi:hypothetical protein
MSYIQIQFAGKERGLKFNQGALIEYQSSVDINSHKSTAAYAMVWAGLKANCYVKQDELDLTFEQVCDEVDNMADEDLLKVLEAFQTSTAYQKIITTAEPEKKNLPDIATEQNATNLQED